MPRYTQQGSSDLSYLLDWSHLSHVLRENAGLIGLCALTTVLLGISYLIITPSTYQSTVTIEVEQEPSRIVNIEDVRKQDLQDLDALKTIEQNLQSRSLFLRVVRNYGLGKDPKFVGNEKNTLSDNQLANTLSSAVSVRLRRGTRLIDVAVKHPDPVMAEKLAKAIVNEFMRQDLEQRSGTAESAFAFLMEEAERLRQKLQRSEKNLQDYQGSVQQSIAEIKKKSAEQEAELASLSTRYKPKHPKVVFAKSQLAEYRAFLQKMPQESQKVFISYDVLTREYESDRLLYETVLKRMKETQVSKAAQASNVRVIGPAITSEKPVTPQKTSTLAFSLGSGLFLGLGLVLGRTALNTSLKTVDQAEQILQLPVLAAIPQNKQLADRPTKALLTHDEPNCLVAEAFRSLRATLALQNGESHKKTSLFTGAVPSEGKSFCCANYAVALAHQGIRTLLIDADLRRPALSEIFPEAKKLGSGLTDYLLGKKDLQHCLTKTSIPNLYLMPGGCLISNPAEILGQPAFKALLQEALRHFDRIVIDSAPILSVADTLLMTEHVEAVYLVVHAGKTPRKAVLRSLDVLERANAKPVGIILNGVAPNSSTSYYYEYSSNKEVNRLQGLMKRTC